MKVEIGRENIFEDLGFDAVTAKNLHIRARLMDEIRSTIKENDWSQAYAAKVLGVNQPRVSDLFRGKIDLFTIDTLIIFLDKLGISTAVVIEKSDYEQDAKKTATA